MSKVLTVIFFCGLSIGSAAFARPMPKGTGSDGGGGCTKEHENTWVLKDFINANSVSKMASPRLAAGETAYLSYVGDTLGFEPLDGEVHSFNIYNSAAYKYLDDQLGAWEKHFTDRTSGSQHVLAKLRSALFFLRFIGIKKSIGQAAFGCKDDGDEGVMIFGAKYNTALLDIHQWNKLDLQSQAGAILKEAFRYVQNEYSEVLFNSSGLNDKIELRISKTLSTIVLTQPQAFSEDTLFDSLIDSENPLREHREGFEYWQFISGINERADEFCKEFGDELQTALQKASVESATSCSSQSSSAISTTEDVHQFQKTLLLWSRAVSKVAQKSTTLDEINRLISISHEISYVLRQISKMNLAIIVRSPSPKSFGEPTRDPLLDVREGIWSHRNSPDFLESVQNAKSYYFNEILPLGTSQHWKTFP